jgi:hypothetical protein
MNAREILSRLAESGTPPDGPSALHLAVGLEDSLTRLERETLPYLRAGGAELRFIYAPYGRGKTHLLLSWQEAARRRGFVTAYIDCQTEYSPFTSLPATYRQIAVNLEAPEAMTDSSPSKEVDSVIEAFLNEGPAPLERLQRLNQDPHMVSDFRHTVVAYGRSRLQDQLRDLQQELKALLLHHTGSRVQITSLYRRYPWLPRPLGKLTTRTAPAWLRSLASLPLALGYAGCLVLFDETEKTQNISKLYRRERQQYWTNLRNLVDHLALGAFRGCALYFAVVDEFMGEAERNLAALSQRLERMRLPGERIFANPRAVWVNIDELTHPNPENPEFYRLLAERLLSVGREAGLREEKAQRLSAELKGQAERFARSIKVGAVRDFVKFAASRIAMAL